MSTDFYDADDVWVDGASNMDEETHDRDDVDEEHGRNNANHYNEENNNGHAHIKKDVRYIRLWRLKQW